MKTTRLAAKTAAVFLLLAASTGGFWASLLTLFHWDDLWSSRDFYSSGLVSVQANSDCQQAMRLAALYQSEQWTGALNYRDQQRRAALEEALSAQATNFRYQIHSQDGALVCGNVADGEIEQLVHQVWMGEYTVVQDGSGEAFFTGDGNRTRTSYSSFGDAVWEEEGQTLQEQPEQPLLKVSVNGEALLVTPQEAGSVQQYGWNYEEGEWIYAPDSDCRIHRLQLVIEYGVADPLGRNEDSYTQIRSSYLNTKDSLPYIAALAVALDLISGVLLAFLCLAAGRRPGTDAVVLNVQDNIPYDLYLGLVLGAYSLLLSLGDSISFSLNQYGLSLRHLVGLAAFSAAAAGVTIAAVLTTAARLKAHTLLRNTIVWQLCLWTGRTLRSCFRAAHLWLDNLGRDWPIVWRAGAWFALYLLVSAISLPTVIFFLLWQALVFRFILKLLRQWQAVRDGAGRIVGGDPDCRIDTAGMIPELRDHAAQLNDLGSAISSAVEERLKSERFRTELITNVSHDLKTPLTSIINYVDLMKKEEIPNPKIQSYLEVLDRKSQRLKKLTEDLVEASKASSGSLAVIKSRLGICQLVEQAAAEYYEKFAQKELEIISTLPGGEVYVEADGRHLWRVLDNLLSNCFKYALEGTRVYLDVSRRDGWMKLTIKNISREKLNIAPDQLMERFVRGEDSRTTEGSGLGLSIARSLTELQGGSFCLEIDGDLFKAIISFPEALDSLAPEQDIQPQPAG